MKNKLRRRLYIINYFTEQNEFKGIYFLFFLLAIYGVFILGAAQKTISTIVIVSFSFPVFSILFMLLLLYNTTLVYQNLSKKFQFYIIRMGNKKNAVLELLKICLLSNILILFLFFVIFTCCLILSSVDKITIYSDLFYNGISDYLYLVLFLGKYICFSLLISLIWVLFLLCNKKKLAITLILLFFSGLVITPIQEYMNNRMALNICQYFHPTIYSSITLDIFYSILYLLFLEIIVYLLYQYAILKKGDFL